jgi:ABC-type lipoprotein export system ATPase subunit
MKLVEIEGLQKLFGKVKALDNINLILMKGAHYAIRGASGSGKSTLLYLMGGMDRNSSGSIKVNGRNLADLSDEQLALYRNSFVGFVFQFHFLLPSMNCHDNILLPAQLAKLSASDYEKVKNETEGLAKRLGVEHCLLKFPYELSGGEQQRINIIRAVSLRPKLLLCDEPTGNLDSINSNKVMTLLRELAISCEATLVVVTHDEKVAMQLSHQLYIQDGCLVDYGK